jgi:hypothetical protein
VGQTKSKKMSDAFCDVKVFSEQVWSAKNWLTKLGLESLGFCYFNNNNK